MSILLVSTYELGHQPLHLAAPAAALQEFLASKPGRVLFLAESPGRREQLLGTLKDFGIADILDLHSISKEEILEHAALKGNVSTRSLRRFVALVKYVRAGGEVTYKIPIRRTLPELTVAFEAWWELPYRGYGEV